MDLDWIHSRVHWTNGARALVCRVCVWFLNCFFFLLNKIQSYGRTNYPIFTWSISAAHQQRHTSLRNDRKSHPKLIFSAAYAFKIITACVYQQTNNCMEWSRAIGNHYVRYFINKFIIWFDRRTAEKRQANWWIDRTPNTQPNTACCMCARVCACVLAYTRTRMHTRTRAHISGTVVCLVYTIIKIESVETTFM